MFPTFATLKLGAADARIYAHIFWALLVIYWFFDGYREGRRGRRLAVTGAAAAGFWVGGILLIQTFLTEARWPEDVVLPLRSWGLMVVIGMCLCFVVQRHFALRTGMTGDQVLSVWVYGGLAAIVGARGLHVLVNASDYVDEPMKALMIWDGGMAFIGGAVAALLFAIVYLKRLGKGWASLDALTLGVPLGHGIGRIGCFMAGCCYGRPTSSFLGVAFPPGSIAQYTYAQAGLIAPAASTPLVHPTEIYSTVMCLSVGLFLVWLKRRPTLIPGMVTAAYLVLYPAGRFVIEMLRGDPERQFAFRYPVDEPVILSTTQAAALVLVPIGLLLLWRLRARTRRAREIGVFEGSAEPDVTPAPPSTYETV